MGKQPKNSKNQTRVESSTTIVANDAQTKQAVVKQDVKSSKNDGEAGRAQKAIANDAQTSDAVVKQDVKSCKNDGEAGRAQKANSNRSPTAKENANPRDNPTSEVNHRSLIAPYEGLPNNKFYEFGVHHRLRLKSLFEAIKYAPYCDRIETDAKTNRSVGVVDIPYKHLWNMVNGRLTAPQLCATSFNRGGPHSNWALLRHAALEVVVANIVKVLCMAARTDCIADAVEHYTRVKGHPPVVLGIGDNARKMSKYAEALPGVLFQSLCPFVSDADIDRRKNTFDHAAARKYPKNQKWLVCTYSQFVRAYRYDSSSSHFDPDVSKSYTGEDIIPDYDFAYGAHRGADAKLIYPEFTIAIDSLYYADYHYAMPEKHTNNGRTSLHLLVSDFIATYGGKLYYTGHHFKRPMSKQYPDGVSVDVVERSDDRGKSYLNVTMTVPGNNFVYSHRNLPCPPARLAHDGLTGELKTVQTAYLSGHEFYNIDSRGVPVADHIYGVWCTEVLSGPGQQLHGLSVIDDVVCRESTRTVSDMLTGGVGDVAEFVNLNSEIYGKVGTRLLATRDEVTLFGCTMYEGRTTVVMPFGLLRKLMTMITLKERNVRTFKIHYASVVHYLSKDYTYVDTPMALAMASLTFTAGLEMETRVLRQISSFSKSIKQWEQAVANFGTSDSILDSIFSTKVVTVSPKVETGVCYPGLNTGGRASDEPDYLAGVCPCEHPTSFKKHCGKINDAVKQSASKDKDPITFQCKANCSVSNCSECLTSIAQTQTGPKFSDVYNSLTYAADKFADGRRSEIINHAAMSRVLAPRPIELDLGLLSGPIRECSSELMSLLRPSLIRLTDITIRNICDHLKTRKNINQGRLKNMKEFLEELDFTTFQQFLELDAPVKMQPKTRELLPPEKFFGADGCRDFSAPRCITPSRDNSKAVALGAYFSKLYNDAIHDVDVNFGYVTGMSKREIAMHLTRIFNSLLHTTGLTADDISFVGYDFSRYDQCRAYDIAKHTDGVYEETMREIINTSECVDDNLPKEILMAMLDFYGERFIDFSNSNHVTKRDVVGSGQCKTSAGNSHCTATFARAATRGTDARFCVLGDDVIFIVPNSEVEKVCDTYEKITHSCGFTVTRDVDLSSKYGDFLSCNIIPIDLDCVHEEVLAELEQMRYLPSIDDALYDMMPSDEQPIIPVTKVLLNVPNFKRTITKIAWTPRDLSKLRERRKNRYIADLFYCHYQGLINVPLLGEYCKKQLPKDFKPSTVDYLRNNDEKELARKRVFNDSLPLDYKPPELYQFYEETYGITKAMFDAAEGAIHSHPQRYGTYASEAIDDIMNKLYKGANMPNTADVMRYEEGLTHGRLRDRFDTLEYTVKQSP